ncbi:hypothetical protein ACPVPU_12435 [Sphingomonas sp. CJ99]
MIAAVFKGIIQKEIRMDQGGKCLRRRLQDTRRTPFRRKTTGFPWLSTGASVGERAARKEKASNFNISDGTMRLSERKSAKP